MANEDEVMALDKQIGRLEETVAKEFFDVKGRFERLEATVTKGFHEHDKRFERLEATVEKGFDEHDKRFERLEATVTKGVAEHNSRFDRLEDRLASLDSKLEVFVAEIRRTTEAIRKEHQADRRLTRTVLADHITRIRALEGDGV